MIAVVALRWRPKFKWPPIGLWEYALGAGILAIATAVGITAAWSPPNSADAMAYHMPRVVYWAQSGSVAFFPTPYFNQVMLAPLAEYLMLHTYLLSGGDHWINLLTFAAWLFSIVARVRARGRARAGTARAVASRRSSARRCRTASCRPPARRTIGCSRCGWWRWSTSPLRRNAPLAGLALGLALATKATAYLFAPPLLAVTMLPARPARRGVAGGRRAADQHAAIRAQPPTERIAPGLRFGAGRRRFPLAQRASGLAVHRLERASATRPSNWARAASGWNQAVYDAVVRLHRAFGLDPQDPDTTWRGSRYEPPRNANHEANANNRWHLLLLVVAIAAAAIRRRRDWLLYAAALVAGAFLLFCFYLKWQPFLSRLELPLFVLAAPLAGIPGGVGSARALLAALACLFLVSTARCPRSRTGRAPARAARSLFRTARDDNYFSDMVQWNNRASYLEAVARVAASGCDAVRIDITREPARVPVSGAAPRAQPARPLRPRRARCAIPARCSASTALATSKSSRCIANMGPPATIGRFLLFPKPSVQEVRAVERVALLGHEAGVADDAAQFLFAGAVMRAGGGDDVLLDHDAAHVVAAEAQAQLAGLQSLRDPASSARSRNCRDRCARSPASADTRRRSPLP